MSNPICFISYSWDDNSHRDWVRQFAEALRSAGVDARLDQWDTYPGIDLMQYMETRIRESDFVILVCTPTFASKADRGARGVGYEKMIVTGEMFADIARPGKFVPVLRRGEPRAALPSYLRSKLYVDFRDDSRFASSLAELLPHLHSSRALPPAIGPVSSRAPGGSTAVRHLQTLHAFAATRLGYSPTGALSWAEARVNTITPEQFHLFESLFTFATSRLGYSQEGARSWAEARLQQWSSSKLAEFEEWFNFASTELGYSPEGARSWAENKLSR